jgi:hypothetical protein
MAARTEAPDSARSGTTKLRSALTAGLGPPVLYLLLEERMTSTEAWIEFPLWVDDVKVGE